MEYSKIPWPTVALILSGTDDCTAGGVFCTALRQPSGGVTVLVGVDDSVVVWLLVAVVVRDVLKEVV